MCIRDSHGAGHGSLGSYAIGFVLSVILTAIPFYMVMDGGFSRHATILTMVVLGLVQVVVHLICFLHMNMSSEGRWNVMAFIFTVIVILLVVGLSLWIIFSADMLMMPDVYKRQGQSFSPRHARALAALGLFRHSFENAVHQGTTQRVERVRHRNRERYPLAFSRGRAMAVPYPGGDCMSGTG